MKFHGMDKAQEIKTEAEHNVFLWFNTIKLLTELCMCWFRVFCVYLFREHPVLLALLITLILSLYFSGYKSVLCLCLMIVFTVLVGGFSYLYLSGLVRNLADALLILHLFCFYLRVRLSKHKL